MIFRISQKLNRKLKGGALPARPLDADPYADWSAHLFCVARTQYVIVCNTQSLYSVVMFGSGITCDHLFVSRTMDVLREFMIYDGLEFLYHRSMVPAWATVGLAKAWNPAVTGSINDLIVHATAWLKEGELSPFDVGFKLNEIPFTRLARFGHDGYGRPRDAFKAMTAAAAT